ncbi:MAG: glycosyltransferase [Candidatus Brocadiaceae bacterium]|nr:glycosyltransferase [Candidatus Brocadiaceae bacterium]
MRVLIINWSDTIGGSAITAYRLSKGLERRHNVECFFLVAEKKSKEPNIICTRKNRGEYYFEVYLNKITNMIGMQYQFFPFSSRCIVKKTKELKPDIIYLRNTHGGYFKTKLIRKLSAFAPIVWTLSDMWSFTGNGAHTFGDESWKSMKACKDCGIYPGIGINTGRWLLRQKKSIYQKANISIVTPSKWLYNLSRQSPVFEGKEIKQIYNGFDLDVFTPLDKRRCRFDLGIPSDARVLMFSAENLHANPWKGGRELLEIVKLLDSKINYNVHILLAGSGDLTHREALDNIIYYKIGKIESDVFMATCLSAADVYIYPTKADNLPNALIEAIACGVPCITFDIGGCAEIIRNGMNGYTVKPFEIETFVQRIMECFKDDEWLNTLSLNARKCAEEVFSLKAMCKNYYQYFQEKLEYKGV